LLMQGSLVVVTCLRYLVITNNLWSVSYCSAPKVMPICTLIAPGAKPPTGPIVACQVPNVFRVPGHPVTGTTAVCGGVATSVCGTSWNIALCTWTSGYNIASDRSRSRTKLSGCSAPSTCSGRHAGCSDRFCIGMGEIGGFGRVVKTTLKQEGLWTDEANV